MRVCGRGSRTHHITNPRYKFGSFLGAAGLALPTVLTNPSASTKKPERHQKSCQNMTYLKGAFHELLYSRIFKHFNKNTTLIPMLVMGKVFVVSLFHIVSVRAHLGTEMALWRSGSTTSPNSKSFFANGSVIRCRRLQTVCPSGRKF